MSPPQPLKRGATYEDLLAVSDLFIAEILDGELYALRRPAPFYSVSGLRLSAALGQSFDDAGANGPGGWLFLVKPELHFGADVLVPDIVAWRRTRLPRVPDEPFMTLPPDWVCEVLSPETQRIDLLKKRRIYAREGVGHLWLLESVNRILEIFRLESGRWVLLDTHGDDEVVQAEPFEAVPLELSRLWS